MKLLILLMAATLTGCATVPSTKFAFNPKTGEIKVESPKEIDIKGLKVRVDGGKVDASIQSYSSHNSPDVIAAVANANAAMAEKILKGMEIIQSMAAKPATGAAIPAPNDSLNLTGIIE